MAEHIYDIRTSAEAEIDRWEAQLVAIEVHSGIRMAESVERVEAHRRLVRAAASRIRRLLARAETLGAATRAQVEATFSELSATLAAARPGDRASFGLEASPVAEAVCSFDAAIDRAADEGGDELTEDLGILTRDFVATTDAFAAELAAAQWSLAAAAAVGEAEDGRRWHELQRGMAEVRAALGLVRSSPDAADRPSTHHQVAASIAQLRQTFLRLVGHRKALSPT